MNSRQLGTRYRNLRETKQLSVMQLSKEIHCNPKTISFYENGDRPMTAEVLKKYSKYFGVTTDYLLGVAEIDKTSTQKILFGKRLRELMNEGIDGKRVTQQDLADATGYTRQAISQYMDGSVLPNIEKLRTIALFFEVSSDYLIGLTNIRSTDVTFRDALKLLGMNDTQFYTVKSIFDIIAEFEDVRGFVQVLSNAVELTQKNGTT